MANPKLYSEFRSDYGDFYLIEIWDEDYTGSDPDRFNITGAGFELNYTGKTDNIYSPVIGSSVSLGMYIRDAATRAFASDFKEYQEDRYYIKIWKGNFDGQDADTWYNTTKVSEDGLVMWFTEYEEETVHLDFFWGGYILQDVVQIEDASEPYVLQLSANDGIARLKNLDGLEAFATVRGVFSSSIVPTSIFPSEYPALKVVSNWWSNEHTYSATEDPMATTAVDTSVFHTYNSDGSVRKASKYEVLENVCKAFGMRFYYSNGSYRAEQIFQRDNDNITEFSYKANGNYIGYETVTRDKAIDQTSNKARLAGNIYNFLPAVNKTTIQTDEADVDYAGVISNQTTQPTLDLGFTVSDPQNWLEINFKYNAELEINTNVNNTKIWYVLDLDISIDDGTTVYYLKRDHTGITPNVPVWTTTQAGSGYQVLVGPFIENVQSPYSTPMLETHSTTVNIITPTLPQDGDIEVQFNSNKWITKTGATRTINANNNDGWETTLFSIVKGNGNPGHFVQAEVTNADVDSGLVYDLGTTKVFNGNGNRGSIYYRPAGTLNHIRTTGFREGNSGSYITAQRLLVNETLALMNSPIEKYQGQIFSSHHFMTRLVFDSKNWLQLGGRFSAREDTWDGEWFAISKETISITNTDDGVAAPPVFSVGASSIRGRMSLAAIDTTDFSAVDAEVSNDLGVVGNTDLTGTLDVGGTLDVTGASTLATTSVSDFTTTGAVLSTINEITANPEGSQDLETSNHFNFITYSGSNGTYTINLPAGQKGAILRFKTDDTISNSKAIRLVPQSGDRIDGGDSYTMDRSYDGISLLYVTDWFIIQKKEK